jgi:hypothetical protein
MFKSLALSALFVVCAFSQAEARKPMTIWLPQIFTVTGIRAEFLFNAMSKLETVDGLAGSSDCPIGTCTGSMKNVTCVKSVDQEIYRDHSPSDSGPLNQPNLICEFQSTDVRRAAIQVSHLDNIAVRELRHALVEITGKESSSGKSKVVRVSSIQCTAHSTNREMDSVEIESTYECKIIL